MADLRFGILLSLKDAVSAGMSKIAGGMKNVQTEANGTIKKLDSMNNQLQLMAGAQVFAKSKEMLVGFIQPAADFEEAMSRVKTRLGENDVSVDQLKSSVLKMSVAFGSTAQEQAGAFFQLLDDGVANSADAFKALTAANKLSKAGVVDLTSSVKAITDTMNAWGLSADKAGHIAEVFLKTDLKGAGVGVGEFARFMQTAAPLAANMGVSLEETGAVIAGMTSKGVKARQAFMILNSAMQGMSQNSKDLQPLLRKIGARSLESSIEAHGFVGTLTSLIKASKGSEEALMKLGLSGKAFQNFKKITGENFPEFIESLQDMQKDSGKLDEKFKEATDNSMHRWRQLQAELEKTRIELGLRLIKAFEPLIKKALEWSRIVAEWIDKNPKLANTLAFVIAGVAAFGVALGGLATISAVVTFAFSEVGLALLSVTWQLGLAVLAVWALWRAYKWLRYSNDDLARSFRDSWGKVAQYFKDIKLIIEHDIIPWIRIAGYWWTVVGTMASGAWLRVSETVAGVVNWIKKGVEWLDKFIEKIPILGSIHKFQKGTSLSLGNAVGGATNAVTKLAASGIMDYVKNHWTTLFGPVGMFADMMKNDFPSVHARADQIRQDQTVSQFQNQNSATLRTQTTLGGKVGDPVRPIINIPPAKITPADLNIDGKKIAEIVFNWLGKFDTASRDTL